MITSAAACAGAEIRRAATARIASLMMPYLGDAFRRLPLQGALSEGYSVSAEDRVWVSCWPPLLMALEADPPGPEPASTAD